MYDLVALHVHEHKSTVTTLYAHLFMGKETLFLHRYGDYCNIR